MEHGQDTSTEFIPTSVHLSRLLDRAGGTRVTVGWLMGELGERSLGLTLFLLALLAFVPGVATLTGVLIVWPAVQMILDHDVVVLPKFVVRQEIRVNKLVRAIRIAASGLERIERLIRPRWPAYLKSSKRFTGTVMLLLGITMVFPIPLGQLLPALVVMLLALAYLEKDGVALMVALIAALVSFAVTAATIWGTIQTIDWLDPGTQTP